MAFLAAIPAAISSLVSGAGAALGIGGGAGAATSGALGLGGVLKAGGAILSGVSGLAAGMHAAGVAKMNAKIAEDNSKRAIQRSQIEQQRQDDMTRGMIGQQEAIQGASGLSLMSRSSMRTRRAAQELGRMDALNVRQAGEMESYNFKVDAANQRSSGIMSQLEGFNSLLSGFLKAGSSLAGGSTSVRDPKRFTNQNWVGLQRRTR